MSRTQRVNVRSPLIHRRQILRLGLASGIALLVPGTAFARLLAGDERRLSFRNLHTGERLEALYWSRGRYLPDALADIDHLLRDFRTGEVKEIDPKLLDLLVAARRRVGSRERFEVISGYRSPKTNAMLHRDGRGVARKSLHTLGQAIDVRLPDRRLADLRQAGLDLRAGGVGYYPKPGFVHLDTGRVRFW